MHDDLLPALRRRRDHELREWLDPRNGQPAQDRHLERAALIALAIGSLRDDQPDARPLPRPQPRKRAA